MAIHSGADANVNDTIGAAKSDVDIADAITKKHDGAAQDAVTATKTTLTAVKADSDVSSAISLKHTQNTDTGTSSASFLINGTAAGRTLIDYIERQLYMRDEPLVVGNGIVVVIGSDNTASVWCDSNKWWDRLSAGFQSLLELNRENCYTLNTNEVLDLLADSPVERHIDRSAIDTGAIWIR